MGMQMQARQWRIAVSALGGAVLLSLAAGGAWAAAMGDGRTGPMVIEGRVLDESLLALNRRIQDRYAQEEMMAALVEPQNPGFAVAAAATAAVPTVQQVADSGTGFGQAVNDGPSLKQSVMALNWRMRELENREVRLAAAVPPVDGLSFDNYMVAMEISY